MKASASRQEQVVEVPPYSKLATMYDAVMSHIDYEVWIGYYRALCENHGITPQETLDVSCGTGKTIPCMEPWCGVLYCMDQSLPMMQQFYREHPEMRSRAWVGEMSHLPTTRLFDLIINIQDSINYYTDLERIAHHLQSVYRQLSDDGAYLFDFSTVENIKNNFIDMDEVYEEEDRGYERRNTFMPRKRLNLTEFYLWEAADEGRQVYLEKHLQRMYTAGEIQTSLEWSPFARWYFYEDESFDSPTADAERVHVIAMKAHK